MSITILISVIGLGILIHIKSFTPYEIYITNELITGKMDRKWMASQDSIPCLLTQSFAFSSHAKLFPVLCVVTICILYNIWLQYLLKCTVKKPNLCV